MTDGVAPTFIIPGASRSGTTTLHRYLSQHPDIFLPKGKEIHFFSKDELYSRGKDYYENEFEARTDECAVGDISPTYWYRGKTYDKSGSKQWTPENDAPCRIYNHYPDVKLIFTLRNPIDRLQSQYWKNVRQGNEDTTPLKAAIDMELNGERQPQTGKPCWLYLNHYPIHLRKWLKLFDKDQILFLIFEDWISDPSSALTSICNHIGIDPIETWDHDIETNPSVTPRIWLLHNIYYQFINDTIFDRVIGRLGIRRIIYDLTSELGKPNIDDETERILYNEFKHDFDSVEELTGKSVDSWRRVQPDGSDR
jgi:hypothetical protein